MPRVVCPLCRTGFEAAITRENFALNCVVCGVAFSAAAYLTKDDFSAQARAAQAEPPSDGAEPCTGWKACAARHVAGRFHRHGFHAGEHTHRQFAVHA